MSSGQILNQITSRTNNQFFVTGLLLLGFIVSTGIRLGIGGLGTAQSSIAGLIFAVCLIALTVTVKVKTKFSRRIFIIGILGGAFLCVPALLLNSAGIRPFGNYFSWGIVVSVVALAEEAFFRGALYGVVQKWKGETPAILIAAVAFTTLHIPLYGWRVVPLDFAVGLWLGMLRAISGSWIAPGITHVVADLAGWWL